MESWGAGVSSVFFLVTLSQLDGSLGERVGIEAEALGDCFRVTAGGAVRGHVHGQALRFALFKVFLGVAGDRGDSCFHPADLVHAALGLEVPAGLQFQPLVFTRTDERTPPESMLKAYPESEETAKCRDVRPSVCWADYRTFFMQSVWKHTQHRH